MTRRPPPPPGTGLSLGPGTARIILGCAGIFFLLPVAASAWFAVRDSNGHFTTRALSSVWDTPGLASAAWQTAWIAAGSAALSVIVLAPTVTWVHLRFPRNRWVFEAISLTPLALPPVVLVSGLNTIGTRLPFDLAGQEGILIPVYTALALPYCYRIVDAAVSSAGVQPVTEAARMLGASHRQVLLLVVIPAIRRALGSAAMITAALCFGEYTVASLLSFQTFPVWLDVLGQEASQGAVALSALSLLLPWLVLLAASLAWRGPRDQRGPARAVGSGEALDPVPAAATGLDAAPGTPAGDLLMEGAPRCGT